MAEAIVPSGLDAGSSADAPPAVSTRWVRVVLATGAVLAVLLLGAALGTSLQLISGSGQSVGGTVDIGFAQDMSVHHRQAVEMATLARDRSIDPAIRVLAFDIETNQLQQIGQMQGWLSLWNAAALPPGRHMTWTTETEPMPGMSGVSHGGGSPDGVGVATMPGMASPAELEQLRAASGAQLDVLFLQLMLRHHQGGIPMADYAAKHAETTQVRNLAEKMAVSQGAESATMTQMITQRGAQPLAPPR